MAVLASRDDSAEQGRLVDGRGYVRDATEACMLLMRDAPYDSQARVTPMTRCAAQRRGQAASEHET